ncbi:hypothetical protein [Parafrankia discariae]|uniref:hypothetical protein n=1 Tax=Parafrankia discariae TaxID=365528 RepID=UPI00037937FC|nr:hypothetical protein [Parafrankia discariae]
MSDRHLPITGELLGLGKAMDRWQQSQTELADAARAYAAALETETGALIGYAAALARGTDAGEVQAARAELLAALRARETAARQLGATRPAVAVRTGRAVLETARQVAGSPGGSGVTS